MNEYEKHIKVKDDLINFLHSETIGPSHLDKDDKLKNNLIEDPKKVFSCGMLFPQGIPINESDVDATDINMNDLDIYEENEIKINKKGKFDIGNENIHDDLNLSNQIYPSTIGLSIKIKDVKEINIKVNCAIYFKTKENNNDNEEKKFSYWERETIEEIIKFDLTEKDYFLKTKSCNDFHPELKIKLIARKIDRNNRTLTIILVNEKKSIETNPRTEDIYFQSVLTVQNFNNNIFLPMKDDDLNEDDDLNSLKALYSKNVSYAIGHGIATNWDKNDLFPREISTDYLPVFELKPIFPRTKAFNQKELNTSFTFLSYGKGNTEEDKKKSIINSLFTLADDYLSWIKSVKDSLDSEDKFYSIFLKHLESCSNIYQRIHDGVIYLRDHDNALNAFRLMNLAMLMQQVHGKSQERDFKYPKENNYSKYDNKWRLFQLAFVVASIKGLSSEEDRDIVDLIWFPTGGGKTEAYLGAGAYSILYTRLSGKSDGGTNIIMRYTLRLLTGDQFLRAATLILSLEHIRKKNFLNINLGEKNISIGLWIGGDSTPNTRKDAFKLWNKVRDGNISKNPFIINNCPWCGEDFCNPIKDLKGIRKESSIIYSCPNEDCHYSYNEMPLYIINEDIYDILPTLIIGTVDMFAQLSWKTEPGRFFGINTKYDPPNLIIQDELHLISGPLGSIVAHYEVLIDQLATSKGIKPKIIASTATIRRAKEQVKLLYNRSVSEFPPKGISYKDNYFSYEDSEKTGRTYIGFLGTALNSHTTAQVRTISTILQAPCNEYNSDIEETKSTEYKNIYNFKNETDFDRTHIDPYATILWYFNSVRELGYAESLLYADIDSHLKNLCFRHKIFYPAKRKIQEIRSLYSRASASEINEIRDELNNDYWKLNYDFDKKEKRAVDVCLATNMISVGVDISRLGLMAITGQPKNTAEYIQASSRVGRKYPGIVLTIYNQQRSRDRSHFENFKSYHQALYRYVEPSSLTPFSKPVRNRALSGYIIGICRHLLNLKNPIDLNEDKIANLNIILEEYLTRVKNYNKSYEKDSKEEINKIINTIKKYNNEMQNNKDDANWGQISKFDSLALTYTYGAHDSNKNNLSPNQLGMLPTMRDVDANSQAIIPRLIDDSKEDVTDG